MKNFIRTFINPPKSKNDIIKMTRLTPKKGSMDYTSAFGVDILLPEQDKRYHVFNATPIKESLLKGLENLCVCNECSWVLIGDYVQEEVLAYIHNSSGALYPMSMVYVINVNGNIFVAIEQGKIRGIDVRSDELFIRVIDISSGQESEWLGYKSLTLPGMQIISNFIESHSDRALGIRLVVDGRIINNKIVSPTYIGKAVDIIFDGSIKETRIIELDYTFLSELNNCEKWLLHAEYDDSVVINIATTEIVIFKKGADSSGLIVGHEKERNINLVTHQDLSIPVSLALDRSLAIGGNAKVMSKVVLRDYSIERSLLIEANRIDILTLRTDRQVINNLLGVGIPSWTATHLESSYYSRALKHEIDGSLLDMYASLGLEGIKTAFSVGFIKITELMRQEGVNTGFQGSALIIYYDADGGLIEAVPVLIGESKKIVVNDVVKYIDIIPGVASDIVFHRYEEPHPFEHRWDGFVDAYTRSACGEWLSADDLVETDLGVTTRSTGHSELSIYNHNTILVRRVTISEDRGVFWFDSLTEVVEPKTMILFVREKCLVRNVDYTWIKGKINIINLDFIGDPTLAIDCLFIACGFQGLSVNPDDTGFIVNGLWSDNSKWQPARRHLARYVAGGRVYDFSEILTEEGWGNEDSPIAAENGEQYCIADSYTTFPWVPNIREITERSFLLNKEIYELSGRSDHVCEINNMISQTITIYSPYLSRLIYHLKAGSFDDLISRMIEGVIITYEIILIESKAIVEFDFDMDISNVGVDQRYITIRPSIYGSELELSVYQATIYSAVEELVKEKILSGITIN